MGENDERWSTEVERPRRSGKRRWLLGCGLGCGLLLLLAVVAMVVVGYQARDLFDPEAQAAELGQVLEVNELPQGFEVIRMPAFLARLSGSEFEHMWTFSTADEKSVALLVVLAPEDDAGDFEDLFDLAAERPMDGEGEVGYFDPELGALDVPGHQLRVLRFRSRDPETLVAESERGDGLVDKIKAKAEQQVTFSTARVDLSPVAKGGRRAYLEYMNKGTLEWVEDGELEAFLASFDWGGSSGAPDEAPTGERAEPVGSGG